MFDPGTIFAGAAQGLPALLGGGGRTQVSTSTQTQVGTSLNINPTIANMIGGSGAVSPNVTGNASGAPYLSGSATASMPNDGGFSPYNSLLNPRPVTQTRPFVDTTGRIVPNAAGAVPLGSEDNTLLWVLLIGGGALLLLGG